MHAGREPGPRALLLGRRAVAPSNCRPPRIRPSLRPWRLQGRDCGVRIATPSECVLSIFAVCVHLKCHVIRCMRLDSNHQAACTTAVEQGSTPAARYAALCATGANEPCGELLACVEAAQVSAGCTQDNEIASPLQKLKQTCPSPSKLACDIPRPSKMRAASPRKFSRRLTVFP